MLDINATKPNLVGSTSNTIHMAVNTFERNRYACRPNTKLVAALVESCRTDSPVTCGNCLKVVKRAHVLADRMMDAIDAGITEAEEHHAADVKAFESGQRDRFAFSKGLSSRERIQRSRDNSIGYWFDRGDVDAVGSAAWAARRWELETAYLAQLVAQDFDAATIEQQARVEADRAERVHETLETINEGLRRGRRTAAVGEKWQAMLDLEHGYAQELALASGVQLLTAGEWQRRLDAIAKGRAEAATGRVEGQRPPYPVDDPNWLRCSLSLSSVTDRLAEKSARMADLLSVPAVLSTMQLWDLGMAAFDHQRNMDIIHARVIGECPGCYRDRETHGWTHRTTCPAYLRTGDGFVPADGPMSPDAIRRHWNPTDTEASTPESRYVDQWIGR